MKIVCFCRFRFRAIFHTSDILDLIKLNLWDKNPIEDDICVNLITCLVFFLYILYIMWKKPMPQGF